MNKRMTPLVIGNWKMNPQSLSLAKKLATEVKTKLQKSPNNGVNVVLAPSFVHLTEVRDVLGKAKNFSLGAQTVNHAKLGAYTGDVSLPMLTDIGVSYVIIGHSERRAKGVKDEHVNQTLHSIIKAGVTAVVCVGEKERDVSGHYLNRIEQQIRKACENVPRTKLSQIVIAYEPIWAIGTGNNATAADVHEMKLFIEKTLADIYGRNFARTVKIVHGGSVNKRNAYELHHEGMMNGFLIGGASLHADEFIEIIKLVKQT
jgi:triosephosphate isomerase